MLWEYCRENDAGVNLTTIPFNAIERVEVLLDGASAIYGSDAVAGVINFIVRKDYRGAEATDDSGFFGLLELRLELAFLFELGGHLVEPAG